jgi:hypothetical protein
MKNRKWEREKESDREGDFFLKNMGEGEGE